MFGEIGLSAMGKGLFLVSGERKVRQSQVRVS
jgi:hypothetical protein